MTNERLNSRSKQSRVQPALRMAQDLVSGAEAAGSFQIAIRQLLGERANVIVQPGEKLLSVRVPDWDRPHAGTDRSESDLVQGELLAFPIVLVLMVLVFGSVVAAGLPLVVGVLAIVGTFLVLLIISSLTEVSIFALNLTTGMGLQCSKDGSVVPFSNSGHWPVVSGR